jgi:multiple sugar transport system substrate-binding protein
MLSKKNRKFATVLVGVTTALVLVGCSATSTGGAGSASTSDKGKTITVWSLNQQPDRLAKARTSSAAFTKKTGINVKVVGVNEDQFPQLLTTAAAAGTLPDIVGELPIGDVRTMSGNDLVNTAAAAQIVKDLGAKTFSQSALAYTRDGSKQVAVPSDGFPLSLIYRKDLFAKAGLSAPKTYADILKDAKVLNSPTTAGFVAGDSASTSYTQQVFEWVALANGCQLVNNSGKVTLDSKACQDAFSFYGNLTKNYSIPGANDSTAAKTAYMGGKAAMTLWASFILPEMAGLDKAILPTCPECTTDPQFIAKNSGFVTTLQGPDSSKPTAGGDVTTWVVSSTAQASASTKYVEYMMGPGYLSWLNQAPDGMFPARNGTASDPQEFATGWRNLEDGVDTHEKLSSIYSAADLSNWQTSVNTFTRWGFTQGQGDLLGAILTQLPVPKAIAALKNGDVSGPGAAKQATQAVQAIQNSLK